MSLTHIRKPTLIVLSLLLAVLSLAPQPDAPASGGNAIALKAPSFVRVANAQEEPAVAPMGFPQDEAGISAYFKSATPVTLADVRSVFRVIEVETADYIIGSVAVPDWEECYDVHLYVHRDGWFLAYYLNADPVSKMIDWKRYTGSTVPTKLEKVLALGAVAASVGFPGSTFYDFRYPNATHLMMIVEDRNNGSEFQINIPGSYGYNARSWSLYSCCGGQGHSYLTLDGVSLATSGTGASGSEDNIGAAQLLPDTMHTIAVSGNWDTSISNAALVLVYRVP